MTRAEMFDRAEALGVQATSTRMNPSNDDLEALLDAIRRRETALMTLRHEIVREITRFGSR